MCNVNLVLLVSVSEIFIEQVLCLIEFKEDPLELFELLWVGSVCADLGRLLTNGKDTVKLHFQVFPKAISMI